MFSHHTIKLIGALLCVEALKSVAVAATMMIFTNDTVLTDPQVDATALRNAGTLNISSVVYPFTPINLRSFTNEASGSINAVYGMSVLTVTNNSRVSAANFVNDGNITVGGSSFLNSLLGEVGGILSVSADNISNSGTVQAGTSGLIRFTGRNVALNRASLLISSISGSSSGSSGFFGQPFTNYFNPTAVRDIYWGAGTSQVMTATPPNPLFLPIADFEFRPGSLSTPYHEVNGPYLGIFGSSFVSLQRQRSQVQAFVWTNQRNATSFVYQVLLINMPVDTNLSATARFNTAFGGAGAEPVVQFQMADSDILTGQVVTNSLYFGDASFQATNTSLSYNLIDPTFRPRPYELSRSEPYAWSFAASPNSDITNINFYQRNFTNSVVSNFYVAYGIDIGTVPGSVTLPTDPTNYSGRIEILADNLDLTYARIRAESTLIIQTTNLISQAGATLDAPVINYQLANLNSTINLTNFVPATVRRFNGQLYAYSATWANQVNGANLRYHVCVLDASALGGAQQVSLPSLNIRGTNVIIENVLNAGKQFIIDTPALTFNAGNQLNLTSTNISSLGVDNFPSLNYFTNFGVIALTSKGSFGSDRPQPFANMVNGGSISGGTHSINARLFDNSGSISANSGPINLNVGAGKLEGTNGSGYLASYGNLNITADSLKIRNHYLATAATLNLTVTNELSDNGPTSGNVFSTALGFNLLTRPTKGDLIGTKIVSVVPANHVVTHIWSGEDRGARRAGYSNNVAVGWLTLGVSNNNVLVFRGTNATSPNALYVDFLELTGTLQTNVASILSISNNFTLYFANANVAPETLDGQLNGRLRWVRSFAGPNSSVDVLLQDGRTTIQVNSALFSSRVADSDADGVVNAFDTNPFKGVPLKSVVFTNTPQLTALVSWPAAAQTDYLVQVATNLPPTWQYLATYTNSVTTNGLVTFRDIVPTNSGERYYRVSYSP